MIRKKLWLVGMMQDEIGVRVLGPVEARATSGWVTAPPQQRLLLALLALRVGQVVQGRELVDALWSEAPRASARASIQVMITRLRQLLADVSGGVVERCGDGHRLLVRPSSIDVQRFRCLAKVARDAADRVEAIEAFEPGPGALAWARAS